MNRSHFGVLFYIFLAWTAIALPVCGYFMWDYFINTADDHASGLTTLPELMFVLISLPFTVAGLIGILLSTVYKGNRNGVSPGQDIIASEKLDSDLPDDKHGQANTTG